MSGQPVFNGVSPVRYRQDGGVTATRPPSERSDVAAFHVMEVARDASEREAAGQRILHLEVGQPSTPAPQTVLDRAAKALTTSLLGYTQADGIPELRNAISKRYADEYGIDIGPERIIVTTGASGSCVLSFLTLWDSGARVGVLEPGYPCYRNDLEVLGITPVPIPVGPDESYRPTRALLDAAGPLDGLILASPSNPTGTVLGASDLQLVLDWAAETGAALVLDEIYHGITYDQPATSILELCPTGSDTGAETDQPEVTVIVMNSFSKYFSMTGWRLGWIVTPHHLRTRLERLAQNLTIAAPTLSQVAAVAAFDGIEECEKNLDRYRVNRSIVVDGLARAGISKVAPADGAFYVWCDVRHLLNEELPTSQKLCTRWLDDIGVAATPGIDFDQSQGDVFVRFSYAGSPQDMSEAMDLLATWTADWAQTNG